MVQIKSLNARALDMRATPIVYTSVVWLDELAEMSSLCVQDDSGNAFKNRCIASISWNVYTGTYIAGIERIAMISNIANNVSENNDRLFVTVTGSYLEKIGWQDSR